MTLNNFRRRYQEMINQQVKIPSYRFKEKKSDNLKKIMIAFAAITIITVFALSSFNRIDYGYHDYDFTTLSSDVAGGDSQEILTIEDNMIYYSIKNYDQDKLINQSIIAVDLKHNKQTKIADIEAKISYYIDDTVVFINMLGNLSVFDLNDSSINIIDYEEYTRLYSINNKVIAVKQNNDSSYLNVITSNTNHNIIKLDFTFDKLVYIDQDNIIYAKEEQYFIYQRCLDNIIELNDKFIYDDKAILINDIVYAHNNLIIATENKLFKYDINSGLLSIISVWQNTAIKRLVNYKQDIYILTYVKTSSFFKLSDDLDTLSYFELPKNGQVWSIHLNKDNYVAALDKGFYVGKIK